MTELRDQEDVAAWVAAGTALCRMPGLGERAAEVAAALLACAAELPRLPPAGVIADVALLLAGGRPHARRAAIADDELRAAVRAYDDDVLTRLLSTPRFDDVLASFAHLAAPLRATATALVVAALVERTSFTGTAISTAALRRVLGRGRDAGPVAAESTLLDAADILPHLADEYLRLARGARQSRALVEPRDVFAIDHLEVLGSYGRRLEAQHLAAASEAIASALPRRLPARRARRGAQATHIADEDSYPAGGFSAITPGGDSANLENLVPSELAFMEPGSPDGGIDLFTLRYVEGELLFYTRDDSVMRREKHAIAIILAPELVTARVKDPALPWQRLVIALGAVAAIVRWLVDQLAEEALMITIAFPPLVLEQERELIVLLLAGEIESGVVTVVEATAAATLAAAARGPAGIRDAVLVGGPAPLPDSDVRSRHVPLPENAAWQVWIDQVEDLLRWLV